MSKALCVAGGVAIGIGVHALLERRRQGGGAGKGEQRSSNAPKRSLQELVRPNIWELEPYRCARDDYSEGVLLDANENAFGPPCENSDVFERYPCPYQWELKELVAKHRGVAKENVFVGVGSDEAIDMIIRIFCTPGKEKILITPPTYGMYSVSAATNDVEVVKVPLSPAPDFQLRVDAMLEAVREHRGAVKMIFACTPGNPTANMLSRKDIVALLESPDYDGIVVADEAYIDFAPEGSSLSALVKQYPRLVVLQTMSKAFGLAGIRCGFALGDPALIQVMSNVKAPYNVNKLTSKVAISAFEQIGNLKPKITTVLSERDRVASALSKVPAVGRVYASDTNFILFECKDALQVYEQMAAEGVVVRYRGTQKYCDSCLRATIGTREENDTFLALLRKTTAALSAAAA